ncbi:glycine betaine ABC transporter substrate-binding protein [Primorskyibacter flagellatus]|uniref:Glycine betaine/proline transport system substrate-binding protein n=1 Tax=Primorskyibacter flagellatus TaxID=1387277 RepID=A0A1W2BVJ0_9RHOB|nr:glycine betaine ABC transporter substrate-binding protein [Primorskyibacter flagellatus]SMC76891.1 glycine betaine/proline transport system substrate-binding protein [Primorskyibacter flagellatus]
MKKTVIASLISAAFPAAALADCGEVSITEMTFASAIITTEISTFLMEQGYGCTVTRVPSDTIPALTSLAENEEPDIVTELWVNSAGEAYDKLKAEGVIEDMAQVLDPGGIEAWWIPTYLADEHPELKTIQGILDNPELVGNRFNNCPDGGWVCNIINHNIARAYGVEDAGIEIFDHGSGQTLAASLAAAYEAKEPWFGYYWEPTAIMGRFDMTMVDIGEANAELHESNLDPDFGNPQKTAYPPSLVYTVATTSFTEREPEVAKLISNISFSTDEMSALLAWQGENNASTEEAAVYFLQNNKDEWADWLNDDARQRLSKLLAE